MRGRMRKEGTRALFIILWATSLGISGHLWASLGIVKRRIRSGKKASQQKVSRVCLPHRGMVLLSILSWYLGLVHLESTNRPCINDTRDVLLIKSVERSVSRAQFSKLLTVVCSLTKLGPVAVPISLGGRFANDSQWETGGCRCGLEEGWAVVGGLPRLSV